MCYVISQGNIIKGDMQFYEWDTLTVNKSPAKYGCYSHCASEYIMFLICQVTSLHGMFKGLWDFIGRVPQDKTPSYQVRLPYYSFKIKSPFDHIVSQNHVIKG